MSELNISTVEALATQDPIQLVFRTTFRLQTIVDWIDKAILYLYLGDKVEALRPHGINGVIELVSLVDFAKEKQLFAGINKDRLIEDLAKKVDQKPDEFKMLIYSLHYDPAVIFIRDIWGSY